MECMKDTEIYPNLPITHQTLMEANRIPTAPTELSSRCHLHCSKVSFLDLATPFTSDLRRILLQYITY